MGETRETAGGRRTRAAGWLAGGLSGVLLAGALASDGAYARQAWVPLLLAVGVGYLHTFLSLLFLERRVGTVRAWRLGAVRRTFLLLWEAPAGMLATLALLWWMAQRF